MLRNKKGQSTLEYVILVAGVIIVIIWFVGNSGSPFQNSLNSTLQSATNGMEDMANRLSGSRPKAP